MRRWEAGGGREQRKKQAWKERTATMAAAEGPEARWHCTVFLPRGEAGGQEAGALQGQGGGGGVCGKGSRSLTGGGAPGGGVAALSG